MALDTRRNIFDFNHIDTTLLKGTTEMLTEPLCLLPQETSRIRKVVPRLSKKKNSFAILEQERQSAVAGGITLYFIVFVLSGFGFVVKTVASFKK